MKTNADSPDAIWVAYPDIKPGIRKCIHVASGHVYYYVSLSDAARFHAKPLDNRRFRVCFQRNWLDDERLSVKRADVQRHLETEIYYWDQKCPHE